MSAKLCLAGKAFTSAVLRTRKEVNHLLFSGIFSLSMSLGKRWDSPGGCSKTSAGDSFCSATAAAPRWIFLEIKGLAGQTPPVSGGAKAAQFSQFSVAGETLGLTIVASSPK
jgi:hypothetical protein